MSASHALGKIGEEKAARYLVSIGFSLLSRNFRTPHGEIDIIARDQNTLVFVEVKTRSNTAFGTPEDSINKRKINHLIKSGQYYCATHNSQEQDIRIDVLTVTPDEIEHFKNITSSLALRT